MSGLRRLCLIVFVLAATLCLCALALPWIGPYQSEATALMDNDYYYIAIQVTLAITVLFLLVTLLRALFTPRKRKTVVVSKSGKDQITVTTKAISSQATHVIEDGGNLIAEKVHVQAKKNGKVSVDVSVRPRQTVNIAQEGQRLHDDLAEGLAVICGENVRRIHLEFLEAEAPAPAQDVVVERIDPLEVPASVYEHAAQLEAASGDISVPLGTASTETKLEERSDEQPAQTGTSTVTPSAPHGSVAEYFAQEGKVGANKRASATDASIAQSAAKDEVV